MLVKTINNKTRINITTLLLAVSKKPIDILIAPIPIHPKIIRALLVNKGTMNIAASCDKGSTIEIKSSVNSAVKKVSFP